MADVYGFNSEEIARELKRQGEEGLRVDPSNMDATGNETIIIKCDETVTPRSGLTVSGPFTGNVVFFGSEMLDLTHQLDEVEFYNLTDTSFEEFDVVTLTRWRELWVITDGRESSEAPKRVRFSLLEPIQREGSDQSGLATATVIDPLNSGLELGDTITVHDPRKEFCYATTTSIGWATKGISSMSTYDAGPTPDQGCCTYTDENQNVVTTPTDSESLCDDLGGTFSTSPCGSSTSGEDRGDEWIIESCTQLVVRVKGKISECLEPWVGPNAPSGSGTSSESNDMGWIYNDTTIPTVSLVQSESYWPYVMWGENEGTVISGKISNPERFAAEAGLVWLERREINADTQRSNGGTTPYDDSAPEFGWVIVAVEKPTANYVIVQHDGGGDWSIMQPESSGEGAGGGFDGFFPSCIDPLDVNVPIATANDEDGVWCSVPAGTKGLARLDKNVGEYMLLSTFSAYYGIGTQMTGIAKVGGEAGADSLLFPKDECGKVGYNVARKWVVFGGVSDGPSSSSECPIEEEVEPHELDIAPYTQTVVTGVTTDSNGDLALETKDIKTICPAEDAADIPIPHQQTDLIEDVLCDSGAFSKKYKTIRYIGNEVNAANTIPVGIEDCMDWEYVFNNHVYNETWWNVDYYDITFPTGCEPCPDPTGCCSITGDQGGTLTYGTTMLESECDALVGTNVIFDSGTEEVVSSEFTAGSGPCTSCCDTLTVSQADFAVPSAYTDGSGNIGFTSSNIVDNGSCSWTIDGTWSSDFDGSTPAGSYSLTYDEGTSTWSISGSVPSPYGGTVTGSAVQDACTTQSGTVLDIPITGSHLNYQGGNSTYNGTVRITFTQSV